MERRRPRKPLTKGTRVQLKYWKSRTGVITAEGPEVSEVKFDRVGIRYKPNKDLEAETEE